jgi:hypothetical protein
MIFLENFIQSRVEENYPWTANSMDVKELNRFFKDLKLKLKAKKSPVFKELAQATIWKMFSVTLSTVVSQPIYLITTRMMAAFVGREMRYKYEHASGTRCLTSCTSISI